MDYNAIVDYITKGGAISALLLILISGYKGEWVFKWVYQLKCQEADFWKATSLKLLNLTDRITNGK
jgi:hypothetical protein